MTLAKQVSSVVKSSFCNMRDLRRLSSFLPQSSIVALANALVASRLDYCNSLYNGISVKQLRRLQSVQNTLCRVVYRRSKYSSVTPLLKELHWLPVKSRVHFKIGSLTYKALKTGLPTYLSCYINSYSSNRNTRLSDPSNVFLDTPFFNSKVHKRSSHLNSSFPYFAPRFWNGLPISVRSAPSYASFRRRLKGHLFESSFQ